MMKKIYKAIHWRIERRIHSFLLKRKIKAATLKNLKLHFGCGGHKISEMINIDFKLNSITDFQMDLSIPNEIPVNSTLEVFSNAFFEHLFRGIRIDHLRKVKAILNKEGFFCYIGIPYFKEVAKRYLDNDNFCNLDLVFRFTHGGGPIERMNIKSKKDIFLAHLHKSLYDENELEKCLLDAGFKRYKIFKYSHPGEEDYKINLGFYGKKNDTASEDTMKEECIMFLKKLDNEKIIVDTIEFII